MPLTFAASAGQDGRSVAALCYATGTPAFFNAS
jgi:hypothetical protein